MRKEGTMRRRVWKKVVLYVLLALCAFVMIFPVIFMVCNSFMGVEEILATYRPAYDAEETVWLGFKLIPDQATLISYYQTLLRTPGYLMMFWNSIILTVPIVLGQIVVATMGGYAFGKLRFPGRDAIFFVFLIIMMMPNQVMMVPNYIITRMMGILGNYEAVILPGIFSAFGVFLMRQFIKVIPDEQMEAAKLDGAGYGRVFTRIVLPQCKGGIASLAILSFIDNWNMVEQPLILLSDESKFPLSVFLSQINELDLGIAFVSGVLFMIPAVLLYLYGENYLIEGIQSQSGAVVRKEG